ncbi:MAG TPA: RtcB family protein [Polyangia bacterium]|nr:RtcB family protein [Polyangia bacterium]
MSIATLKSGHVPVKLWAPLDEVESQALTQLRNIASLPWCWSHVAAMPDVHLGKGATVGSVVAMKGAVSPAAVGVDIGCGMAAVRTNLAASHLPDDLKAVRRAVERAIPVGFHEHRDPAWRALSESTRREARALMDDFTSLSPAVQDLDGKAARQLGTLGGGNHFIELCLDTRDRVWLMLHSGSRNVGKTLAEVHIARARALAHNQSLPDRDLAVFLAGTPEMEAYRRDLFWAQRYARCNREAMLELYVRALGEVFSGPALACDETIQCHHNYVAEERYGGEELLITRKGAIRAGAGELGIIPGSMGTRSFIVRGLGSEESFCSASHGAGRRMSRGAAKRAFTVADLERQTAGVECRKDSGVLDEIPGAYKDIDQVMRNQRDLVEIVEELRQVMCCKG